MTDLIDDSVVELAILAVYTVAVLVLAAVTR